MGRNEKAGICRPFHFLTQSHPRHSGLRYSTMKRPRGSVFGSNFGIS